MANDEKANGQVRARRGGVVMTLLFLLAVLVPAEAAEYQAGREAFERGDFVAALREFRPLAEQGDAGAQFLLGVMDAGGKGVPQDHATAVRWYRQAAEQRTPDAQFLLGVMDANGEGMPQYDVHAYAWLNIAAAQGFPGAADRRDRLAVRLSREEFTRAQNRA